MDTNEYRLLNNFQRDLPLCAAPYARIGEMLGMDEARTIETLSRLIAEKKISRVGAVFQPNTISMSTLAALAVPESRLVDVADLVTARSAVSHNYERAHRWNLWFVATERNERRLTALLDDLERRSACRMLRLPLVESYHIDLGFDLAGINHTVKRDRRVAVTRRAAAATRLSEAELRLADELCSGLALLPRPYQELAVRAGTSESSAIDCIARWIGRGVIKRFGVIVRHHELGFTSNAMVAFDIPDDEAADTGLRIASLPEVTLCARRVRSLPEWPYNVYCMIHGTSEQRVLRQVESLRDQCGLQQSDFAVLFSKRRFKQQAARIPEQVLHG